MNSDFNAVSSIEHLFSKRESFYPINVKSNGGIHNTADGIEKGSKRIVKEIIPHLKPNIQLSFIGVSLGGLYARWCTYLLQDIILEQNITLSHFITIATPHVGLRNLLPYSIEQILWYGGGQTGKELLLSDSQQILYTMTSDSFLKHLSPFWSRVMIAPKDDIFVPSPSATSDWMSFDQREKEFEMTCKLRSIGWDIFIIDYGDSLLSPFVSHILVHKNDYVLKTILLDYIQ